MDHHPRKKIKIFVGVIRDATAITKALLSTKRAASNVRVAIIKATAHRNPSVAPSGARVDAILSLGQYSSHGAFYAAEALVDRLNGTNNASVAMKCLHIIHNGLQFGCLMVKDQFSTYSTNAGRNFLNMVTFRDKSDSDAWELSSWVRWYASVLEQELIVSRVLQFYFASKGDTRTITKEKREKKVSMASTSELVKQIVVLITFVGLLCDAPDAASSKSKGLVVESLGLISEDYDSALKEIVLRVREIDDRILRLSYDELSEVLDGLRSLEEYKERLGNLFLFRKKHEAFWETVRVAKERFTVELTEKAKGMQVVVVGGGDSRTPPSSLPRLIEDISATGHWAQN